MTMKPRILAYSYSENDPGESSRLNVKSLSVECDAQRRWQMRSTISKAPGPLISIANRFRVWGNESRLQKR